MELLKIIVELERDRKWHDTACKYSSRHDSFNSRVCGSVISIVYNFNAKIMFLLEYSNNMLLLHCKKKIVMTKEIIEKISSYNLFNYLLPGILFVYAISNITNFNLLIDNVVIAIFLYYFVGLVINRFGSIVIQPLLETVKFVRSANYKDFLPASEKDNKIELLSEINNMFRTFISMLVLILLTIVYDKIAICFCIPLKNTIVALVIALLVLFLFSYRKQTTFIRKRVERLNNKQ
jgi:hypothetical protein